MATPSSPILIYQPGGGVPVTVPGVPPSGGGITGGDITQLVNGQSYIEVVFDDAQASADWEFVELVVVNTIDPTPLNIWSGIVTDKSITGFTLQFNGMPDSSNYFLHWSFTGIGGGSAFSNVATTYLLSGSSTGTVGSPSAPFTVQLPSGKTVPVPVIVTPNDGGAGGTFTPTSVTLTTVAPSATFTYTAVSVGAKTIGVTNSGGLINPPSLTYTASAGTGATTYTLTGPSSGVISAASTNFTAALPGGSTVASPVIVTPGDGGAGGTFTPTTVTLTTVAPSATFTYTPASYGAKTISATNSGGLTNPANLTYTSVAGTYTLSGPSSGTVGVASTNFTVALPVGGVLLATVTVTPSDGGGGGTFTPTTVNLTTGAPSATFTYTPASTGAKTISVTNSSTLTNPANLTYTASAASAIHLLNTLISYWKLDEASGTRNDSVGTNHLADTFGIGIFSGKINNAASLSSSIYLRAPDSASLRVTGDFTFSFWINIFSLGATAYLAWKSDLSGNTDYLFQIDTTTGCNLFIPGCSVNAGSPPSLNTWYHVVGWYDSSDGKVRLRINDATTYVSSGVTTGLTQTATTFNLGYQLNGAVDEVGFWKRKLTAAEITALYNSGAGLPLSSFTT